MTTDRVLALSLRPTRLDDLVGQDNVRKLLKEQLESGRVPHFFILAGPVGSGKTTLARILARTLQSPTRREPVPDGPNYDIQEINAANRNGVDDVRDLVAKMRYRPVAPSTAKVVILDEAHQLTNPAQNALITETEDVPDHVFYIFCTSNVSKIISALKSRAFIIQPLPLDTVSTRQLLQKAAVSAKFEGDLDALVNALDTNEITSPRLILQAAERYFGGSNATDSVYFTEGSSLDTMGLCRNVSGGNWKGAAEILTKATKADVYMLRSCVLGYMKSTLLKCSGSKALTLAKAMDMIGKCPLDDTIAYPMFLASICQACEIMSVSKTSPVKDSAPNKKVKLVKKTATEMSNVTDNGSKV